MNPISTVELSDIFTISPVGSAVILVVLGEVVLVSVVDGGGVEEIDEGDDEMGGDSVGESFPAQLSNATLDPTKNAIAFMTR